MLGKKRSLVILALISALSIFLAESFVSVYADNTISCYQNNCTTSFCSCSSNCYSGYFNIYSSGNCSGIATSKIIIANSSMSFIPTSSVLYGKILCGGGNVSQCYILNLTSSATSTTTTTAITTSTTTTTSSLLPCPNECCVNLPGYQTVTCGDNQFCASDNTCQPLKTDCPNQCCVNDDNYNTKLCTDSNANCVNGQCVVPGPNISYNIVIGIAAVIIVVVLAFYFLRDKLAGKKGASNSDAFEALKKKWSSR